MEDEFGTVASSSSSKWLKWAALGLGGIALVSLLGRVATAPAEAQHQSRRRKRAVATAPSASGFDEEFEDEFEDEEDEEEVYDPRMDARILKEHRRAMDARNSRAGNWADVAGSATANAIKLMESSPRFRNSVQLAEMHFIRFEVYTGLGQAFLQFAQYHLEAARKCLDNAVVTKANQANHTQLSAAVYSNLAEFYVQLNEYEKVEPVGEKAIELFMEIFHDEPDNINVALAKTSLGIAKASLKKYQEAEELFKASYKIFRKSAMQADEVAPIQCVTRLGNVLLQQGKHAEAEKILSAQYNQLAAVGAHQRAMGIMFCLARLYYDERRFRDARPLFEKALDLSRGTSIEQIIRSSLHSLLREAGDDEEATKQAKLLRESQFVAFTESCCFITRSCTLDGDTRQYTLDLEIKIAPEHYQTNEFKIKPGTCIVIKFEVPASVVALEKAKTAAAVETARRVQELLEEKAHTADETASAAAAPEPVVPGETQPEDAKVEGEGEGATAEQTQAEAETEEKPAEEARNSSEKQEIPTAAAADADAAPEIEVAPEVPLTCTIEHVVQEGERLLQFVSPIVPGDALTHPFRGDCYYEIVVTAYEDSSKATRVASHFQLAVDKKVAKRGNRDLM